MINGTIIVLNGTSSSSKSSLVYALQELLPGRFLERPLRDDVLGLADRPGSLGRGLAALSRSGINVLADHVLVEREWVEECARLFEGLPAYLIEVRRPLELLEQRERSRKNRTLGQAILQVDVFHHQGTYDLEVDTTRLGPQDCARLVQARLLEPPCSFASLRRGML
jgi:chloramphenicol 3-O phosphotransferase